VKVKIDGLVVEVKDGACAKRPCFSLGFDKGSFTPGVGYTSYHRDAKGRTVEHAVCGTRYYGGCPSLSVCPVCDLCSVDPPGTRCEHWQCPGVTVSRGQR
jgi:hypothetical protein